MSQTKEELIDRLISQIKSDIEHGDTTVLAELLGFVPDTNLVHSLPEEEWTEFEELIEIDLFTTPEALPEEIRYVIEQLNAHDYSYETNRLALKVMEQLGYTFDFGLDATPFNLKKIS